jgi:hypothetical protein
MHTALNHPARRRALSARLRRTARPAAAAAVAVALLVLAAAARADTVTTKSGETFKGTIVEQTDEAVVLKTISGKMNIPMNTVKTIDRDGGAAGTPEETGEEKPPPRIVPVQVAPADADEAFKNARTALVAGQWVEAGGLLEGLLRLDLKHFALEKRLAATGALITCYLQIRDARGAATAIGRRAALAEAENDKLRLVAASDMLRELGTTKVGEKRLGRFEEVMEAAMPWQAAQCLATARKIAGEASGLNNRAKLDDAAEKALAQLARANVYVPGFSDGHREAVLAEIVTNVLNGAREAVAYCKKVRPELTKRRLSSAVSKPAALAWNQVARVYLGRRQAGADALNLLPTFATRHKVPDVYAKHKTEAQELLAQLDEYQYYPVGTRFGPYSPYYGTTQRVHIRLRTFGGAG